jgi:formate hydrogenlyase transcriptional activator
MVYLLRSRCPNYFRRYGNPPQSSKLRMTTKSVRTRDVLLGQISARMKEIQLETHTTLFHQGEAGDAVYLVVEGTLRLENNGTPLLTRGPGECVGEFALIDDAPRSASAVAATDVRLLRWERQDFQDTLAQSPEVGYGIFRILTQKLRQDIEIQQTANVALEKLTQKLEDRVQERTEALSAAKEALSQTAVVGDFVGRSKALHQVQAQLAEVAPTHLTVLILGETGTGKGLAARSLHDLSTRHSNPIIQVKCGALPRDLVESELFGHERGAFTGAVSRKLGKVELAQGGTLFLDEIGDMPLDAQVKLLRLLEEKIFERVGGTETMKADARVVAATNRDLQQMVSAGTFREDLYFRLRIFPIQLPPLRERIEDIPLLARYAAKDFALHLNRPVPDFSPVALAHLQSYAWPGNVRELEHFVQRAVLMCKNNFIDAEDIALGLSAEEGSPEESGFLSLAEQEKRHIARALKATDWVIYGEHGAGQLLDVHPDTLRYRMKKHGLRRPR